jgi:3-dehydroquinate synthetase
MGLIEDPAFFAWCEEHGPRLVRDKDDRASLAIAVAHAAGAKARIVAADEREGGVRALLNLGHTFAHGLEAEAGMDGALLHGEAVGCGIALAFGFSKRLGLCSEADHARVARHLREAGFATRLQDLPGGPYHAERLLDAIRYDKKNEGGRLTFILARGVGKSFIARDVDEVAARDFLHDA